MLIDTGKSNTVEKENEENLRERGKFASIKSTAESCRTEPSRMCYLPEECYIPLSFPLKFCYFLTRIEQFPPTTSRLTCLWQRSSRSNSTPCLSSREKYKIFDPRAFTFMVSHEGKDSGNENSSTLGTRTSIQGGRDYLLRWSRPA